MSACPYEPLHTSLLHYSVHSILKIKKFHVKFDYVAVLNKKKFSYLRLWASLSSRTWEKIKFLHFQGTHWQIFRALSHFYHRDLTLFVFLLIKEWIERNCGNIRILELCKVATCRLQLHYFNSLSYASVFIHWIHMEEKDLAWLKLLFLRFKNSVEKKFFNFLVFSIGEIAFGAEAFGRECWNRPKSFMWVVRVNHWKLLIRID